MRLRALIALTVVLLSCYAYSQEEGVGSNRPQCPGLCVERFQRSGLNFWVGHHPIGVGLADFPHADVASVARLFSEDAGFQL